MLCKFQIHDKKLNENKKDLRERGKSRLRRYGHNVMLKLVKFTTPIHFCFCVMFPYYC